MRLLIATPAFGGQVCASYAGSLVETVIGLTRTGVTFGLYTLSNESLISRARNKCAHKAITEKYDKLLFIDSDLTWRWEYVLSLISSDKGIIGGTYPVKQLPIKFIYHPIKGETPNEKGELRVKYVPTGFLCIDVKNLSHLAQFTKTYRAAHPETGNPTLMWDFFPVGVNSDSEYESEDFGFCSLARNSGQDVWLQTNIILPHTGAYTFNPGDIKL